jgi:hypothetical protein
MPAQAFGGGSWRTPHLGQISAFALMIAPHSEQNFSSTALRGVVSPISIKYHFGGPRHKSQNRVFATSPASLFAFNDVRSMLNIS